MVGSQFGPCSGLKFSCAASLTIGHVDLAGEGVPCRGLGSRWFTERFHRNALVNTFQDDQYSVPPGAWRATRSPAADFINARPRGDIQLMWLRLRSPSSAPHDAHHSLPFLRQLALAYGRSEECPRRRLPRSRTFRVHTSAASIRFVRKRIRPSIWRSRRLPY